MRSGTIVEAARSDNRFMVWASAIVVAACVVDQNNIVDKVERNFVNLAVFFLGFQTGFQF